MVKKYWYVGINMVSLCEAPWSYNWEYIAFESKEDRDAWLGKPGEKDSFRDIAKPVYKWQVERGLGTRNLCISHYWVARIEGRGVAHQVSRRY